jgi:hypothetical protein
MKPAASGCGKADGGVGRGPGGPPYDQVALGGQSAAHGQPLKRALTKNGERLLSFRSRRTMKYAVR